MYDAQTIFSLLAKDAKKSTAAKILSVDILKYITSTKLGDGTWKGSTKAFTHPALGRSTLDL